MDDLSDKSTEELSEKRIYLLNYSENTIKIYGKDAVIIIGTTDDKYIFIRLIISKDNIYENVVKVKRKKEEDSFHYILKLIKENKFRMNYSIKKNTTINKNIIYFEYNVVKTKRPLMTMKNFILSMKNLLYL